MVSIRFKYEILYRRKGNELVIDRAEVISRNSIDAEEQFKHCPMFKGCEVLDVNMLSGSILVA